MYCRLTHIVERHAVQDSLPLKEQFDVFFTDEIVVVPIRMLVVRKHFCDLQSQRRETQRRNRETYQYRSCVSNIHQFLTGKSKRIKLIARTKTRRAYNRSSSACASGITSRPLANLANSTRPYVFGKRTVCDVRCGAKRLVWTSIEGKASSSDKDLLIFASRL